MGQLNWKMEILLAIIRINPIINFFTSMKSMK